MTSYAAFNRLVEYNGRFADICVTINHFKYGETRTLAVAITADSVRTPNHYGKRFFFSVLFLLSVKPSVLSTYLVGVKSSKGCDPGQTFEDGQKLDKYPTRNVTSRYRHFTTRLRPSYWIQNELGNPNRMVENFASSQVWTIRTNVFYYPSVTKILYTTKRIF